MLPLCLHVTIMHWWPAARDGCHKRCVAAVMQLWHVAATMMPLEAALSCWHVPKPVHCCLRKRRQNFAGGLALAQG